VSLPTLEDVIGYEENRPEILNQLKNGYPRFFKNKMVQKLEEHVKNLHQIDDKKWFSYYFNSSKKLIENLVEDHFESIILKMYVS
jgi:cystathionine gamma-synthase